MKRLLFMANLFFLTAITLPVHSLSLDTPLNALSNIEIWLHRFEKYYERLPSSLMDLINNTPSDPPTEVMDLFSSYVYNRNYIFDFNILNESVVQIILKDDDMVYIFENHSGKNYFYMNGYFVMEYIRDASGIILNQIDHFDILNNKLIEEIKLIRKRKEE